MVSQQHNYKELSASVILGNTSILKDFLNDYVRICKPTETISASCSSCIESYRIELIKTTKTMEAIKNSGYKLHKKYEGITLFGSGLVITNLTLSDEIAKKLLKEHPHGEKLFLEVPKQEEPIKEEPKPKAKSKPRRKKSK